ncbi:MAG: MATE family efflux transporter [Candidatus Raymondbacteria bacterium RifOxyC12_full_50_8]|uniref:Multidrug-efflux transporter n=1 Tax=Candidatus Raymondbacteria bacterium RIFOXYD12_FULL_49_13 TaxID=1817890 RepID=A0A1F7FGL7_UNCRA|nr:MAG: MATE family efflux transporter [Candidatus Raymondbacteria bacterium RIFOXYA2_FULL_49_16]OGJ99258.1 MAG: MATE family efflux transporter [Candidatus Raymondbacteria bacterium RifOxyB12_full_50_8]OGK04743.1 MAG: MATE family efflux transporter [Candidatus Raymondbacteria bacterium RifOxyC12_full_50_8]OGK05850.1 MAG: MATE family efflux transporter [Candidatus Raymondbacteria bacterium RIFOXYD12_FULL_49_13]OGP43344.1 MAG: MATE family efflux transporter [Candidatus Raymondbacteria bacterium R
MITYIKNRWNIEGGYRVLMTTAFPLIMSSASWSLLHFIDRMFLAWYSSDAVAAAMPAGILNFTLISVFIGTASYAGTFIAQYFGANMHRRIGPVLWQGLYIGIAAGALIMLCIPFSNRIFTAIGHQEPVRSLEAGYFAILTIAAIPAIINATMAGFFSGLGRTMPVMWINLAATGINLVLDYLFIFGKFGIPEMGMNGAAIATDIAAISATFMWAALIFTKKNNDRYAVRKGWRFNRDLFFRLLRFGLPNGLHMFIDVAGFTVFILIMGRLGTTALAASTIAFNINSIAWMPMFGFGMAVSILVGQYLGANRPASAEKAVWTGFHVTFLYTLVVASFYAFAPGLFLMPYQSGSSDPAFPAICALTAVLLRFVAVYSLFDTCNIIFASAVKGAGDTRFVMFMLAIMSSALLIVPAYVVLVVLKKGVYAAWVVLTVYCVALAAAFVLRFLGGKWKSMRVIEENIVHPVPHKVPEVFSVEV